MKKFATLLTLALLAGCAERGYLTENNMLPPDSYQAWTDDKNHYHPEWRYGINTPEKYPRETPERPSASDYMGW